MDMYSMYIDVLSLSYMSKLYVQFLFVVILITSQQKNIINNRPSFSCFVKNIEIILSFQRNDRYLLHIFIMPYFIVSLFTLVQYIVCNIVANNIILITLHSIFVLLLKFFHFLYIVLFIFHNII